MDNQDLNNLTLIKPFIRWAGGKTWLLKHLIKLLPHNYQNYHEPFLGGGSIFFYIRPPSISFVGDLNKELINVYEQVKNNSTLLIEELKKYKNTRSQYEKFKKFKFDDSLKEAARFVFLNKTSFNGIYRVNRLGQYNVPYGNNPYKQIVDSENLHMASKLLKKTTLFSEDFQKSIERVQEKDLVILDPPYTTAHRNNGFIEYNQKLFVWEDQERLADYVSQIIRKKAFYILMNAAHDKIKKIYKGLGKRIVVERIITVGGKYAQRKKVEEYIFINTI